MSDTHLTQLGRYQILGELGRGAMGVVYKAQDLLLDRIVAIKTIFLSADISEHAKYEARFLQEARAAGRLSHPSIITIYDVGRENNMAYMAMEMLHGMDLRERIAQRLMLVRETIDLAVQIADGLGFAHEHGVVHRDIKPANIMIVRGERTKIMDFGIARLHVSDIKTQTGMLLGTPKYMSPEQAAGQSVDHRTDIFSLGTVLYEMLTSRPPFSGADMAQLMYNVATAQPLAPSRLNLAVPPILDLITARAMEKDAGSRYQSAYELAEDLRTCLAELEEHVPSAEANSGDATLVLADVPPSASEVTAGTERLTQTAIRTPSFGGDATLTDTARDATRRLPLSRRFDSSKALQRLAVPSAHDRDFLASSPRQPRGIIRIWRDREQRRLLTIIVVSALTALIIVFA